MFPRFCVYNGKKHALLATRAGQAKLCQVEMFNINLEAFIVAVL